jgi:VWFA-related protein
VLNIKRVVVIGFSLGILLLGTNSQRVSAKSKQRINSETPSKQAIFKIRVNAVVLNATATDKDGNPVTDLTADDFRIYDNNIPQKISTFAMESFGPPDTEIKGNEEINASDLEPTKVKPKNALPRMISLVIDDLTMETVLDFPRTVDAMKKFVLTGMTPLDQVSIMSASRIVQYSYTNDKNRLINELESLPNLLNKSTNYYYDNGSFMGEVQAWDIIKMGTGLGTWPYLRALRIKEEGEFRTQDLLYTLRQNIRVLKHFEGNRTILLFSDGFLSEPASAEAYQLQEIIDMAIRAGIVMNTVSTRPILYEGKSATPLMPVDIVDRSVSAMPSNAYDEFERTVQHSSLTRMAEETGGLFFGDNNIYNHIKTIAGRRSSYYILTYIMDSDKPEVDYHKIRLEVTRPGVHLSYRKGYYSPKEDPTFDNNKKEDILAAINSQANMKEIPIKLSYNYSQQEEASYAISFIISANIRGIKFIQESDRRVNQVSFIVAIFDEADKYVRGLERLVDFRLHENNYADLFTRGLSSRIEFKLPYGRYKIKAVVREENQKKMGSISKVIEIP